MSELFLKKLAIPQGAIVALYVGDANSQNASFWQLSNSFSKIGVNSPPRLVEVAKKLCGMIGKKDELPLYIGNGIM